LLACLETAEALGFAGPIEPELGALFERVLGTHRSARKATR